MAAPTQAEDNPPSAPLKYKTWVLKVSIHCEGCKKKVRRILHNIEDGMGVYTIGIDSKIHKVTVTGNVESDTLIKKLGKSGKHAELWPQNPDHKAKKSGAKSNREEKDKKNTPVNPQPQHGGECNEDKPGAGDQRKDGDKGKVEEAVVKSEGSPTAKNHGGIGVGNSNDSVAEVSNPRKGSVGKVQFQLDANAEGKKPEPVLPAEKKVPEGAGGGPSGNARAGKNKEKKGHSGSNNTERNRAEGQPAGDKGPAVAGIESPVPGSINPGPPIYHHRVYEYPPPGYYTPPTPMMNAVSYPSSSYTASYYAAAPPYSYAYMHAADANVEPRSPSDSFGMFSEENANGCSVM